MFSACAHIVRPARLACIFPPAAITSYPSATFLPDGRNIPGDRHLLEADRSVAISVRGKARGPPRGRDPPAGKQPPFCCVGFIKKRHRRHQQAGSVDPTGRSSTGSVSPYKPATTYGRARVARGRTGQDQADQTIQRRAASSARRQAFRRRTILRRRQQRITMG
ncbi:uncharacterized protein LOC134209067 [Armigeres subalbatus]|uniref:uncharacterized protein LOC134209067 n=1 Tax=Armigeres subalbatus TaxID=124917 RepID=UPI002ED6697B